MERQKIVERIEAFFKRDVVPEAQAHSFRKFLALVDCKDGKRDSALVHMCNSLGAQLRNDVKFFLSDKDKEKNAPVLDPAHLSEFRDCEDLVAKLREMPSEWTVLQISREMNPADVVGMTKEHRNSDPTLLLCRLPCGEVLNRVSPYLVRIPPPENAVCGPNIMERLSELLQVRREYYNNRRDKQSEKGYRASEAGLGCYWLREWKCLLNGRFVDARLENEIHGKIAKWFEEDQTPKCDKKCMDILFHLVQTAHLLKPKELMKAVRFALYGEEKGDPEQWSILMDQVRSLNNSYSKIFKKLDRHPVIIIIEPSLELFPWEMTVTLKEHPVSRILSLHLLYALFKYHQPQIVNGFRQLPVSSAYCLLNPDKSLKSCQEQIGNFLNKDFPWIQVEAGTVPDPVNLLNRLSEVNLFMFCGHGSASQYFKSGAIKKALVDGLVLLYGCSSNLPRGRGGRTPYQNDTYTYLTNGCPTLIGSLYDITSSDADRACIHTMTQMLPQIAKAGGKYSVKEPIEPDVLRAVVNGKSACLKFWSKCCFIVRGIPVKISITQSERTEILKSLA